MPFVYEDTVQGEARNALAFPSSTREVLTETFAQAYEENPVKAVRRLLELREDERTGPRLAPEVARAKLKDAGLENDLRISDAGITDAALTTLMERKRIEKRRQEVFARSEGGVGETAARFGVAFATTLVDPVSAGLNFVPVVGQARYAQWLSRSRSILGRMAVRARVGAIEGAAGAAIAEVPIYAMRTQEQADYDTTNSLLNVAFGGVVGAGLHTTVGSAAELISRRLPQRVPVQRVEPVIGEARAEPLPTDIQRALFSMEDVVDRLPREVQQAALRAAVGQAAEGRAIDIEAVVAPPRQTVTPEFRQWFGDSKVVDQSGQPVRVYHGTDASFEAFDAARIGSRTDEGQIGHGFYFSTDQNTARSTDTSVVPAYLSIQNPLRISLPNFRSDKRAIVRSTLGLSESASGREVTDAATAAGYDGIALDYAPTGYGHQELVAFQPEQIKSAIGNSGRFDPKSASLTDPVGPEFRAASEHADATLAREIEPTTEANLKAAEDEAALAETDARALAERLGVKYEPEEALTEGLEKAERWARVAELATVCLVRGG
jgi:hypothetical protein